MNIRNVIRGFKLSNRSQQSAIDGFVRWWLSELWAMVPESILRFFRVGGERLVIDVQGTQGTAVYIVGGETLPLGDFQFDTDNEDSLPPVLADKVLSASEIIVRLPTSQVLRKTLILPIVAEQNLRQVIGFELDRQTPFSPEQIYYDFRRLERLPDTKQVRVELAVLPRQVLDELLDRLGRWGVKPSVVSIIEEGDVSAVPGSRAGLNLLPVERRPQRNLGTYRLNAALAGVALVLVLAVAVVPLWQQRNAIRDLESLVNREARQAQSVLALQEEADRLQAQAQFLVVKKQSSPVVVEVLDELARIIPDDTWLNSFNIDGVKIQIQGLSPTASQLIELIEASPRFKNTSFVSPVTKDQRSGLERFQIAIETVPGITP